MRRKMRQLVKTEQGDLSALPIIDGAVELQMGKLDLAAARPAPLAGAEVWGAAEPRIELSALIPQSAGIGDLRRGAPEEYRGEVRNAAGMAQRFQDQSDGLPAARSTPVDADVGGGVEKLALRPGLRRNRRCGELSHGSPSPRSGFACRCFRAKYCACASRSTAVSSGSRLLSGSTRTGGCGGSAAVLHGAIRRSSLVPVCPGLQPEDLRRGVARLRGSKQRAGNHRVGFGDAAIEFITKPLAQASSGSSR